MKNEIITKMYYQEKLVGVATCDCTTKTVELLKLYHKLFNVLDNELKLIDKEFINFPELLKESIELCNTHYQSPSNQLELYLTSDAHNIDYSENNLEVKFHITEEGVCKLRPLDLFWTELDGEWDSQGNVFKEYCNQDYKRENLLDITHLCDKDIDSTGCFLLYSFLDKQGDSVFLFDSDTLVEIF